MASPASSHTETTSEIPQPDLSLQPSQKEPLSQPAMPSSSENVVPPSIMVTNLSPPTSSKEKGRKKKKKEKPSRKETASVPPELLVVETTVPLTKDGFLKAPEPSIKTSELWQSQVDVGINQALQLACYDLSYRQPLLGASLYFWSPVTNTFHFPCGMMTPTLLGIAHIAGLPSNGDAISWIDEFNIEDSIGIDFSEISYTNFIKKNKGADVDLWLKAIFHPRISLAVDALPKKAINGIQLTYQPTGDEMWAHSLVPQKLRVGVPGDGTLEMRYKLNLYSPQFISNTAEFDDAISPTEERVKRYRRVPGLTRCCYSTQSFDNWWSSYFISHYPSLEQALTNLNLASIVQSAPVSKKTKDRLPDPVKGILNWDYITNPLAPYLCGVTLSPYEWCRETHHLISGFTKIERYPLAAKPIAIKGTASEPTKHVEDWVSDAERSPKKKKERKGSARAKSSSIATITSRKRNAVERASDAEGPVAKMARTSQPQKKSKNAEVSGKQEIFMPNPTTQSNLESARAILSNLAMFNRSVSAGLVGVSSSQASTESTRAEYTPLGQETVPVLVSTSCPADTSTMAVSSSDLILFKPEASLISPIKEILIEEEGPFVVPTPEAGDLDFADDEFNLDSILSEAQELFLTAVPVATSGEFETEKPFPSGDGQTPQRLPRQSIVGRAVIVEKVNRVLGCLNHSLEKIVASAEIKSQLLEATTFLNQHANSEASSLKSFIEDLYNNNVLLESSSADLQAARDDVLKHKKDMGKYGSAFSKVKPLVDTGVVKEQEAKSLEETQRLRVEELERELLLAKQNLSKTMAGLAKIKATNHNLKNTLLGIEQKRASSTSKHAATAKTVEEVEARHRQAVETSSRLNKRQ
ncbi:hypothetical protein PIB30_036799 [Stylosanthes scabra]|uniref:Aminotransferase-like plant mobile domain-containing protein n=1 Tax=Stylosanthes scabra TaxID=79078 RepID=A0ABU6YAT9_9FABA|nr:hypothetical protein [Stylosanthes scabra]